MIEPSSSAPEFTRSIHVASLPGERVAAQGVQALGAAVSPTVLVFRKNIAYDRLRRVFDVIGALVLLAAALPILFAASLAILLEDGRPVFFRQRRVGRFGRIFTIYKLRTMRREKCVDSFSPTTGSDPRITRVGYWLRRSSIDELPQLLNILRGEMAFVGPRPEMPFVVREYQSWQHLRHLVTPGVTGFWQTTCRSTIPLHLPQATMLDLDYVRQASHKTDVAVLVRTIRTLISAEGAY
jgi:lipopolysaccharide/colanic/teichoic acid biosynthesis glycosyltransferase